MPKFELDVSNLTAKDIWIDFLKNLGNMDRIHPSVYERADEGLLRLLEKANIAALTEEEIDYYEASMKRLEDEMDMEEQGFEKGKAEERAKTISILKDLGLSDEEIQSRLKAYDEKSK